MSGAAKKQEMLGRQIGWLAVYASELQHLEQPGMPAGCRERALRIRKQSAPMFFWLVSGLLHDALIQGLANILDKPSTLGRPNLTLESEIQNHPDLMKKLEAIRNSPTYGDIKKARNKLLSHNDCAAVVSYDAMTLKTNFPNLKPSQLQSLVEQIRAIMAKLTGELPEKFVFLDWKGVEVLFRLLEQKQDGSKTTAGV